MATNYRPLFDSMDDERARYLQEGRNVAMMEVYQSLPEHTKEYIDELCAWMVKEIKGRNPKARFSWGNAFELIFETLQYQADPHRRHRGDALAQYSQARRAAGHGYQNPFAE